MKQLAFVVIAACTDSSTVLAPVIDSPVNDDDAVASNLDFITLGVAHAGAELDIASKTFTRGQPLVLDGVPFGDDLVIHMTGRAGTSTSEVAYGRTCQFQVRADGRIPSPHLFFARAVKFGSLATQPLARVGGSAITFTDGSGLLIGGTSPDGADPLRQVERFDPRTGEYHVLDAVLPRTGAAAALLVGDDESRVTIVGGLDLVTGVGATYVELIRADRSTNQIETITDTPQMARVDLTATTLVSGDVVVIGGQEVATKQASSKVALVTVLNGTPIVTMSRATLANPRSGHTATRLADDVGASVLVAGGVDDTGMPVAAAELYKPLSDTFSTNFNRSMIVPRRRHQAVLLPDGSVLFIGGIDATGQPVTKLELFALDTGFVETGNGAVLPPNAGVVDFTATVLPDGRVLIAGGSTTADGKTPTNNVFIASLDPVDGTVDIVPTDRLAVPRAGHQATLLCDGTVLISGGTPGAEVYERYNPPSFGRR